MSCARCYFLSFRARKIPVNRLHASMIFFPALSIIFTTCVLGLFRWRPACVNALSDHAIATAATTWSTIESVSDERILLHRKVPLSSFFRAETRLL